MQRRSLENVGFWDVGGAASFSSGLALRVKLAMSSLSVIAL